MIGAGAIGTTVIDALKDGAVPGASLHTILRSRSTSDEIDTAIAASDVVVEATTVEAARHLVPRITRAGKDVVACSCGVFAEEAAAAEIETSGPGRVLLPAGALGGFDILAAAARAGTDGARVEHTTIKTPRALDIDEVLSAPREVFRGTAREAALTYPRTSNSSVALAMATLGLDRVEVVVVADPNATNTRHIVKWESPVGNYELAFENVIDVDSPGRTSAITAWSVVETLTALTQGVGPGTVVVTPRENLRA